MNLKNKLRLYLVSKNYQIKTILNFFFFLVYHKNMETKLNLIKIS